MISTTSVLSFSQNLGHHESTDLFCVKNIVGKQKKWWQDTRGNNYIEDVKEQTTVNDKSELTKSAEDRTGTVGKT